MRRGHQTRGRISLGRRTFRDADRGKANDDSQRSRDPHVHLSLLDLLLAESHCEYYWRRKRLSINRSTDSAPPLSVRAADSSFGSDARDQRDLRLAHPIRRRRMNRLKLRSPGLPPAYNPIVKKSVRFVTPRVLTVDYKCFIAGCCRPLDFRPSAL